MADGKELIDRGGRPVILDRDRKQAFLEAMEHGRSTGEAAAMVGVSRYTVYWNLNRDQDFRERYESAKAAAVDALIDRAEEVAEGAMNAETGAQVAGAKVLVDHLWRRAARIAPQRWGEKPSITAVAVVIEDDQEAAKRLAFLEALNGAAVDGSREP